MSNYGVGVSSRSETLIKVIEKTCFPAFPKIYMMAKTLIQGRYVMSSYEEPKAEMEAIQQQMVEAKKNERGNALKEVKLFCKEFNFTTGMLKGSLAEGRKKL